MSKIYKVEDLSNTSDIVKAALDGTKEFEISENDLNKCLVKFGLTVADLDVVGELVTKGSVKDWFESVNDENIPEKIRNGIYNMCSSFKERIHRLKEHNPKLYKDILILIDPDNTSGEFEFPEISKPKITTVENNG